MTKSSKHLTVCKTGIALSILAMSAGAYAQSTGTVGTNSTPQQRTDAFAGGEGGSAGGSGGSTTPLAATISNAIVGPAVGAAAGGSANVASFTAGGPVAGSSPSIRRFALSGQKGEAAAGGGQAWNAWFNVAQNNVAWSFAPVNASGRVNAATVGVDYTFSNKVILGLALSGDRTRLGLNGSIVTGNMSGSGTTGTLYLGVPIDQNWTFDAGLGTGRTKVDLNVNNFAGSLSDRRTVGNLGVTYRAAAMGNWNLSGRAAYIGVSDRLGAFTLTNGALTSNVNSASVNIGQLRVGGQAAYNAGSVTPYVGVTYVYDVSAPGATTLGGQTSARDRDAFNLQLGLGFRASNSIYGNIQYSTEQSRKEVKNDQIMFSLGVRF